MLNERKLTKTELDKREDIIMNMKGNKRALVKKYGKDAEAVMYGRATNQAKKQTESMKDNKLREMVKDALKNPKAADLNKDGKLSDYEEKRGAAIEKNLKESDPSIPLEKDFTYDYEDIGQFYLEGLNKPHSLTQDELGVLGKKVVDQLYKGDIGVAYDDIVFTKRGKEKMTEIDAFNFNMKADTLDDEGLEDIEENMGLADIKEMGYEAGEKAFEKIKGKFKNKPDHKAYREGFFQGFKDNTNSYGLNEEKDEMSLRNIGSADLEEMGYEAGGKATYTYATVVTRLQNRPDKLSYSKGFIQGVKDELGSSLSEDLSEDIDLGHQDNEPGMLKAELYHIGSYAMELYKMMDDLEGQGEVDFPAWWQSKITTAKNNISGAKHYLEFELKEPAIDAVVDRLSDVAPEMEIDEELFTPNEIGDEAIDKESASGAFQENLDLEAKVDALQRLKRGEIDTLPSVEDAKAALVKKILDKLSKGKPSKDEKQLDEYTDNSFVGAELISDRPTPQGDDLRTFQKYFPTGVDSMDNAVASLQAHDNSGIKARMGRYAPMFVHIQYHDFKDAAGEKYRAHQKQFFNSNFKDKDPNFNPGVTKLTLTKLDPSGDRDKEIEMGSILVKTDEYIKDLKQLNVINRAS